MASEARAEFDPKEIARAAFPTAFRGYDQDAVRRYLSRLATAINRAQQVELLGPVDADGAQAGREVELQMEAAALRDRVDELEDLLRTSHADAAGGLPRDLDEAELMDLVGDETARILKQARSAAADIVHRAEAEAEAVREQADLDARSMTDEADEILATARVDAEETRSAAVAEAKRTQARAKAEAKRSREAARAQADDILAEAASKVDEELQEARIQAAHILSEAEQLREDVLGDLVRRRRLYREKLSRMTKARDRLSQALTLARGEIDTINDDLAESDAAVLDLNDLDDEDEEAARGAESEEVQKLIADLNAGLVQVRTDPVESTPDGPEVDLRYHETEENELDEDELQVEYLNLDETVVSYDGSDDDDDYHTYVETETSDSDEGLMALNLTVSSNGRHDLGPDGDDPGGNSSTVSSASVIAVAEEIETMANATFMDDDLTLDLSSLPVLGTAPGSMHRAATRGDLPRATPYAGTLPAAFEGRDTALARALPGFRRKLKRAVNDDQSHVLDRLRAGRGQIQVDDLPTPNEQLDRYLDALHPALDDVVRSGADLLNRHDVPASAVENLCTQLGRHVVECLRTPTIDAIEAATSDDREAILEPVRATYRDFRNGILPDLIDDALHEAFALGLFSAIERDERVLWLTDPRLDPDPICEENSAAPALAKGTLFPSGHVRPLSMPGCRCLAIPAR